MDDVEYISKQSMEAILSDYILDKFYPVGKWWISDDPTDPSEIVGGTWKKITGVLLKANDDTTTSGSDSITLLSDNLPSHNHTMSHTHTGPSHTHTIAHTHSFSATTSTNGYHSHKVRVSTNSTAFGGKGNAIGNKSWNYTTATGNSDADNPMIVWNGNHSHTISGTTGGSSASNTGSSGTGNTGAASTSNTGSTGSGKAITLNPKHRNMYCWVRVA